MYFIKRNVIMGNNGVCGYLMILMWFMRVCEVYFVYFAIPDYLTGADLR